MGIELKAPDIISSETCRSPNFVLIVLPILLTGVEYV